MDVKDEKKAGVEKAEKPQTHKIRIILTSRNSKSLQKGEKRLYLRAELEHIVDDLGHSLHSFLHAKVH